MKTSALLLWATFAGFLGQALGSGDGGNPFKKIFVYHTPHGPIYITEWKKRFYPVFKDESLGSYSTPEDAAEDLAFGRFIMIAGIDLTSLRIPRDLNQWQRL